ncbi:MAG TPA: HAD family hydrolase [Clostridia bacterium]|nr:HAD family hydrolase [Clostridia bacterium]
MEKWILFDCMETLIDMTDLPKAQDYALWAYEGSEAENLWAGFNEFYTDYRAACVEIEKELPRFREYEMKERYARILSAKANKSQLDDLVKNMDDVFWERYSGKCYARESVLEAVDALSKKHPMGVVSNFKIRSGVRSILENAGLLGYFEFTVNSCEIGWKKPHDNIYNAAKELAGVDFGSIVFIGDDYGNDYEKPEALGCKTVLYDPSGCHPEALSSIRDFKELLKLDI